MAQLSAAGESTSTKRMLTDAKKVYEAFRVSDDELEAQYPVSFDALGADIVCNHKVYAQLANYMLYTYKKADGGWLDNSTIIPYLRALLRSARDKYKPGGSADVAMFFTCLDRCSPPMPAQPVHQREQYSAFGRPDGLQMQRPTLF